MRINKKRISASGLPLDFTLCNVLTTPFPFPPPKSGGNIGGKYYTEQGRQILKRKN